MKSLFLSFLFLSAPTFAADAVWIHGKWDGYCQVSNTEEDGSLFTVYEFRKDHKGNVHTQSFKDNRCTQKKEDIKKTFSYEITRVTGPQLAVKITYDSPKKGEIVQSEFSFKKYGTGNRASIGTFFLLKELSDNQKLKTLLDSKDGVASGPTYFSKAN